MKNIYQRKRKYISNFERVCLPLDIAKLLVVKSEIQKPKIRFEVSSDAVKYNFLLLKKIVRIWRKDYR